MHIVAELLTRAITSHVATVLLPFETLRTGCTGAAFCTQVGGFTFRKEVIMKKILCEI